MYKHYCIMCLVLHKYKCICNISFSDRFLGTDKVKNCLEYKSTTKNQNRYNKKVGKNK